MLRVGKLKEKPELEQQSPAHRLAPIISELFVCTWKSSVRKWI